jgi:hypothetical protein
MAVGTQRQYRQNDRFFAMGLYNDIVSITEVIRSAWVVNAESRF